MTSIPKWVTENRIFLYFYLMEHKEEFKKQNQKEKDRFKKKTQS